MQWTIIRPGGLKSEPATGSGILTEDRSICGAINREDVAALVVKALFSNKSDGKVCTEAAVHLCTHVMLPMVREFVSHPCIAMIGRLHATYCKWQKCDSCCLAQVLAAVDKAQLYGEPKVDVFQL